MQLLKIIETCAGKDFCYHEGEVVEVHTDRARELVSAGLAKPHKKLEKKVVKAKESRDVSKADGGSDIQAAKQNGGKKSSKGRRNKR